MTMWTKNSQGVKSCTYGWSCVVGFRQNRTLTSWGDNSRLSLPWLLVTMVLVTLAAAAEESALKWAWTCCCCCWAAAVAAATAAAACFSCCFCCRSCCVARLIFFWYCGLRARISSKLRSSGGCTILEVVPVAGITVEDLAASPVAAALAAFAELVVGGALIVALLQRTGALDEEEL